MATDVQARDTGNSAMFIALVAVILLVIGAFAYFGSGNRIVETVPGPSSTTVITQPAPAPPAPDVHIEAPPVVVNPDSGGNSSSGSGGGSGGTSSSGSSAGTSGGASSSGSSSP